MKIRAVRVVPGLQVHYADDHHCIASKALSLVESVDQGASWQPLCRLPVPLLRSLLLRFSLYGRLTRGGVHAVLPIQPASPSGWIVVAAGKLFQASGDGQQVETIFQIERGHRPLRRGICLIEDRVLVGEYWGNPARERVNIYSIQLATRQVETLYQFNRGSVRHVHAVEPDPYSESVWISTGDDNSECMVARLDQRTNQLEPLGQGSQKWRAISFAFRPEAVYWGTDSHLGKNQIWRFERATGTTQAISEVIGPVYYNVCLDNHIVFGTTMEKGEGQQDDFGHLYAVDVHGGVEEIWKQRKDRWDARLFGYGSFEFAEGRLSDNRFWVTVKGFEGGLRSILFRLEDD